MSSISSAGSSAIPAAQPTRRQAERSVQATETELTLKQEQKVQGADDNQSRGTSEQAKTVIETPTEKPSSPSVTPADNVKSAGEQQKIEAAQQEAQRAEFDQQAGSVRDTEPNDVRPLSSNSSDSNEGSKKASKIDRQIEVEPLQNDSPAIALFNQLQNVNESPRQGREINQFA
jgi:hypothetical protein